MGDDDAGGQRELPVERRIWAVRTASRCFPPASCLTQALAAQVLLASAGIGACVQIGVSKVKSEALEAHAWLEKDGEILLGGSEADKRYARLFSFAAERGNF